MTGMRDDLIKARILRNIARRHSVYGTVDIVDMAEAAPEKPLPDVPLHQRGFGVIDEERAVRAPLLGVPGPADALHGKVAPPAGSGCPAPAAEDQPARPVAAQSTRP